MAVPGEPGEFCPKRRVELPLCVPSARANCKKTSLHARDARLCARSFRGGLKTLILSGAREAARVTLNRPERRNALSHELTDELVGVLQSLGARPDVPAIVLEGAGIAFSASHDLNEMVGRDRPFYQRLFDSCTELMETIHRVPQPGDRQGARDRDGRRLPARAACHLAVAADNARFAGELHWQIQPQTPLCSRIISFRPAS